MEQQAAWQQMLKAMPGTSYARNLCAIRHEVRHREPLGQELLDGHEIAIMFRTDCFRACRSRKLEGKPSPIHIYDAVNGVVARALARDPLHLPTFAEVMAEGATAELPAATGCPGEPSPKRRRFMDLTNGA